MKMLRSAAVALCLLSAICSACGEKDAPGTGAKLPVSAMYAAPAASGLMLTDRPLTLPVPAGARAVNGSLVSFAGTRVVAYRLDSGAASGKPSAQLALVEVDDDFTAVGEASIVETRLDASVVPTAEDPRAVVHDGRLFVAYNSTADGQVFGSQRDMFLVEVDSVFDGGQWRYGAKRNKRLLMADGKRMLTEKNWTPFSYGGQLHFVYRTNPPDVGALREQDWQSDGTTVMLQAAGHSDYKLAEPFGILRGGTPALQVPGLDGFLSFHHTFLLMGYKPGAERYAAIYMAGAYTFAADPPFASRSLLPYPIVPPSAYDEVGVQVQDNKLTKWITYPTGLVAEPNVLHVSYSLNDRQVRVMTLDTAALKSLLQPASTVGEP